MAKALSDGQSVFYCRTDWKLVDELEDTFGRLARTTMPKHRNCGPPRWGKISSEPVALSVTRSEREISSIRSVAANSPKRIVTEAVRTSCM